MGLVGENWRITALLIPASDGVHGPGEMQMRSGFQDRDFFQSNGVVPLYQQSRAQLAEVLDEVVGEGVVVIDDEKHEDLGSKI